MSLSRIAQSKKIDTIRLWSVSLPLQYMVIYRFNAKWSTKFDVINDIYVGIKPVGLRRTPTGFVMNVQIKHGFSAFKK